jgi:hypothetical protein
MFGCRVKVAMILQRGQCPAQILSLLGTEKGDEEEDVECEEVRDDRWWEGLRLKLEALIMMHEA